MEEVIEALREKNEPVPVPLELPDFETLVTIEEAILLPLPEDYRQFLLEVSDVIYGNIEPATAADPSSHTYLPEMTAMAWDQGLPRYCIPICEIAGGYDCISADETVRRWSHGQMQEEEWQSIWHWARDVWLAGEL